MKNFRYLTVLCCSMLCIALVISGVYCTSVVDVVAYTAAETFTVSHDESTEYVNDTLDTIDDAFSQLGLDNVLVITDLIRYLSQDGNTFTQWVYDNYGEDIKISESIKNMSTGELVMYLTSKLFSNETTTVAADMGYTSITTQKHTSVQNTTSVNGTNAETTTVFNGETTTRLNNSININYKTGDVDADGEITVKDARLALRAAAELDIISALEFKAADVNDDGKITSKDARSILRYSVGLTKGF